MIQRLEPDLSRVIVLVGLVMAMLIVAHIDVALAIVSVPSSSEHGHESWIGPSRHHLIVLLETVNRGEAALR